MKNYYYTIEFNQQDDIICKSYPKSQEFGYDSKSLEFKSRYFLTDESASESILTDLNKNSEILNKNAKITHRCVMTENPFKNGYKNADPSIDKSFWVKNKERVFCILNEDETNFLIRYTLYSEADKLIHPESFIEYNQHIQFSTLLH